MYIGKWLLIAALLGGGLQAWKMHQHSVGQRALLPNQDSDGFVPVQWAAGAAADTVVVLAPLNCPSAAAKRAEAMVKQLNAMGIPNVRANNYSASITSRDQLPLLQQTSLVLGGEVPVVIINGKGKANPTVDEVAAEYNRGK
jgi:hypothetical protein